MPVDPPFLGRGRAHGPDLHKVQIRDGLWPPRCHVFSNSGHSLPVLSSSAGTQREKKEVGAGGGGWGLPLADNSWIEFWLGCIPK